MDSNRRKDLKTPDDAVSDDEQLHSKLGVLYADVSAEGIIGGIYKGGGWRPHLGVFCCYRTFGIEAR